MKTNDTSSNSWKSHFFWKWSTDERRNVYCWKCNREMSIYNTKNWHTWKIWERSTRKNNNHKKRIEKKKHRWFLTIYRRLQLFVTSFWFCKFDQKFDMKVEKVKLHLSNSKLIHQMFRKIFEKTFDVDLKNVKNVFKFVRELCDEIFKLKILIRNVITQINILLFVKHFDEVIDNWRIADCSRQKKVLNFLLNIRFARLCLSHFDFVKHTSWNH